MKVLVIGANGRLGRASIASLHARGHTPVALVRTLATFPAGLRALCAAAVVGDATDPAQLAAALRAHDCRGVVQAGGYTPFLGTSCNMPEVYRGVLEAVEVVGRERGGGDGRVRVWLVLDLAVMDSPYGDGGVLGAYLPPVFPIHRLTYPLVRAKSTDTVAWSMMCPSEMCPEDASKVRLKNVAFGGPQVPHWPSTGLWIPLIGRYINAIWTGLRDMPTSYEKVADFMSDDFTLGLESGLIGAKVAPNRVP